jgi:hypothetical protein
MQTPTRIKTMAAADHRRMFAPVKATVELPGAEIDSPFTLAATH